jgi:hypothetical protein
LRYSLYYFLPQVLLDADDGPLADDRDGGDVMAVGTRSGQCGCASQVTDAFKRLSQRSKTRQTSLATEPERLKAAQQFCGYIEKVRVCHRHVKATATAVGLRTRFADDVLTGRLMTYARSRTTLGTLKTASETY